MEVIRDKTIDAVNEYAKALAADTNTDAACSLSLFDTIANIGNGTSLAQCMALDCVIDGKPIKDWPALTRETYQPRGATPLNDAVIATIDRMEKEWHRPEERISLVIMTDGHENSSAHTNADVKAAIERVQGKGWMVVFLGANIDSFAEGVQQRGTHAANTMDWAAQNVGVAMQSVVRSHAAYAATGQASMAGFTEEERKRAKN
jgi:hypothetical protein